MPGEFFMNFTPNLDSPDAITLSIDNLLRDVKSGKIKIPDFQREFKWDVNDRIKLLDSIYRGYPIGSLLFWETTAASRKGQKENTFGPATIDKRADIINLIVDGQQRITTIIGTFLLPDDDVNPKWRIYFDLKTKEFKILTRNTSPPHYWLPLREAADTLRYLAWLRKLNDSQESESLINAANQMAKAVREYKIPAYIVRTDDKNILREIFERLNAGGHPLSGADVFKYIFFKRD